VLRTGPNPQLNADGELQHLLTLEGMPAAIIERVLDTAVPFVSIAERDVKKVPLLRGKTVFNLFFENSTRTRTTFEIAAKRLSADVININVGVSSTSKGETLLDTIDNLVAMNADMFVVRHGQSGAPHLIAQHLSARQRSHTAPASSRCSWPESSWVISSIRRSGCRIASPRSPRSSCSSHWA